MLPCLVFSQAFSTHWFLYAGPINHVTLSCVLSGLQHSLVTLSCVLSGLQHSLVPVRWTNQPCYLVLCTVRPSALPGSCTLDQPTMLPCLVYCQAFSTPWLPCLVYCQAFSTPWFLYAGPTNRVTLSCVLSGLQHSLVPVRWTNQSCYLVLCTVRPSALPGSCTLDQPTMLPCLVYCQAFSTPWLPCLVYCQAFSTPWFLYAEPTNHVTLSCVLSGLQHSLVPVRWTNQPCYLVLCTVRPSALPGSCTLDQPTVLPCLVYCQAFSTPWFLYAGPTNHVTLSCVLTGLQHSLVPVRWTSQPCYLVLCTVRPSALPGSCTLDQPTVLP